MLCLLEPLGVSFVKSFLLKCIACALDYPVHVLIGALKEPPKVAEASLLLSEAIAGSFTARLIFQYKAKDREIDR